MEFAKWEPFKVKVRYEGVSFPHALKEAVENTFDVVEFVGNGGAVVEEKGRETVCILSKRDEREIPDF